MEKVPSARLNDGNRMPLTGLFLSEIKNSSIDVKLSVDCGFRHFQCVGDEDVQTIMENHGVSRDDLYVSATFKMEDCGNVSIRESLTKILDGLNLAFLNLYVLELDIGHNSHDSLSKSWMEMEEVQKMGLTRSIGLRNCNKTNLELILRDATIFPVVNQIENDSREVIQCCRQYGILTCYVIDQSKCSAALGNDDLIKIADSYNRTPLQVFLRHLIDLNGAVLLAFECSKYLVEAVQIFDFHLAPESVYLIHNCVYN